MKHLVFTLLWTLATHAAVPDDLNEKEITEARKLYVAKCAKCHQFYEPKSYKEPEWRIWIEKMSRKSKLNPAQEKLINRYLDSWRADRLPKTAKPRSAASSN